MLCPTVSKSCVLCAEFDDYRLWEEEDGMSIDEEEVPPSHNLQDMPWDSSFGESRGATCVA